MNCNTPVNENIYKVYKITNLINRKLYIGLTSRKLSKRLYEHSTQNGATAIHKAIKKYGKHNFIIEKIDETLCRQTAMEKEQNWIIFYDSMNHKKGYNLTTGGEFFNHTPETKKKISDAQKGSKNHMYGKTVTEEQKYKISLGYRPRIKIKCNETGMIFNSIKSAALTYGLNRGSLSRHIRGLYKRVGKYTFAKI